MSSISRCLPTFDGGSRCSNLANARTSFSTPLASSLVPFLITIAAIPTRLPVGLNKQIRETGVLLCHKNWEGPELAVLFQVFHHRGELVFRYLPSGISLPKDVGRAVVLMVVPVPSPSPTPGPEDEPSDAEDYEEEEKEAEWEEEPTAIVRNHGRGMVWVEHDCQQQRDENE